MKMATMLNEDNVQQKLECITSAQDSIQSLSLWIIHHKSESNHLVKIWLKVLKKVDVSQKLLLFYLCNDVVQNCKRKQAVEFLESFKGVLSESIQLVKDTTIKPKVLRILNIWQERNVYKVKFITKLKAILESDTKAVSPVPASKEVYKATKKDTKSNGTKESKVKETPPVQKIDSAQLLAEFKPQLFIHKVTDLRKLELENDIKQQQLSKVKFDESSLDTIKQLKDKTQGNEFSKNFEEAVAKLESTVKYLEQDVNDRGEVIDLAETSELFYDEQYKEAKIVVNAYRNFGTRINNMKKKVEDIKNKFPATPSPIPSPTGLLDAPSPEPTPPQEDPNDYADPLDMDIDSDDDMKQKRAANDPRASHNKRFKSSKSVTSVAPVPVVNTMNLKPIVPTGVPAPTIIPDHTGVSSTILGGFTPIMATPEVFPPVGVPAPVIVSVPEQVFTPVKEHTKTKHKDRTGEKSHKKSNSRLRSVVSVVSQEDKKSISNRSSKEDSGDEGCSTPVQDETVETVVQKENPIDFLTKLLSKTNSAVPASGASFLQNLSLLTSTVKSEFEHNKGTNDETDQKVAPDVPVASKEWPWNESQPNSQNQPSNIPAFSGYSTEESPNTTAGQDTASKISVQATLTPQVVSSIVSQNLSTTVPNIPQSLDVNAASGLSDVIQQSPSPEIPTPGISLQYPPSLVQKDQHAPVLPPHMLLASQPTSPEMYPLAALPPTSSSIYLGQQGTIPSSVYSVQPTNSDIYPQHPVTQPPASPLVYPGQQNLAPNSSTDVYLGAPPIFSSNVYPHQQMAPPSPDVYPIQSVSGAPQHNIIPAGLTTPSPEVLTQTPIFSNLHSAFSAPPPPPPPITQSQPISSDSGLDDILNQIVTGEGFPSESSGATTSNDPYGNIPHFANDSFLTNFKPTASFLTNSPSKAYNSGHNVPYSRSNSSGAVVIPLSESYNEDPAFSQTDYIESFDERDPSEDIEDFSEKLSHGNMYSYDKSRPNLTCLTPQEDNNVQQVESIQTISTVGSHEPKPGRQNVDGVRRQSVVRHIERVEPEPEPNQEDFSDDVSMEPRMEHSKHESQLEDRNNARYEVHRHPPPLPLRHHYPHSPRVRSPHRLPPPPPEHFYHGPPRRPFRHPGERFRGPPRDPYFYDDPYGPPPPKRPYPPRPPPDGYRRRPFYRH